jgi:hypothetical protein
MIMVQYLAALGAALIAVTASSSSWAQDPAPVRTEVGPTDHSRFVGDFAIGFLGLQTINIADVAGTGTTAVNAPVIGARYWLDEGMGIDAGIGFNFGTGSSEVETGGATTETDDPQPTAIILHGGVPFALAASQYFVFELIPELNVGFAGNTVEQAGGDVTLRGFHLDIGARAGAEVHFGFIDLPQLSLQAGIGVALAYDSTSSENEATDTTVSSSGTFFGTTVGNDPWDIFTSSISALYYFDR